MGRWALAAALIANLLFQAACAGAGYEAFREAELARSRGRLDEARTQYERAIEQEPTNAEYRAALSRVLTEEIEAHRREAVACEDAGDLEGAARFRHRALEVQPERSDLVVEYRLAEARAAGATAFELYALVAELLASASSAPAQEAVDFLRPLAYLEEVRAADAAETGGRYADALGHLKNAERVEPEMPGVERDRLARVQSQAWIAAGDEALSSDPVLALDLFQRAKASFEVPGLSKRLRRAERRARPILEKLAAARERAESGRGRDALRLYGQVLRLNGGDRTGAAAEREALRRKLMLQECRRAEQAAERGSFLLAHRALKDALEFSTMTGRQRRLVLQGIDESRRRKHMRAFETLSAPTLPSDDPVLIAARGFVVETARRAIAGVETIALEKPALARKKLKALKGLESVIPELTELEALLETATSTTSPTGSTPTGSTPPASAPTGDPRTPNTLTGSASTGNVPTGSALATDAPTGGASTGRASTSTARTVTAPRNSSGDSAGMSSSGGASAAMDHDEAVRLRVAELARDVAVLPDPRGAAQQLWSELRTDPSSRVLARSKTVLRARARRTALKGVLPEVAWALEAAGILDGLGQTQQDALAMACARLAEGELEEALRLFLALGSVSETVQLGAEVARNLRLQELRGRFNISKTHAKVLHEAAILAAIRALAPSDSLVRTESKRVQQDAIRYGLKTSRTLLEAGHMGLAWVTLRRVAAFDATTLRTVEQSVEMSDVEARLRAASGLTLVVEPSAPTSGAGPLGAECRDLESSIADDFISKASTRSDLGASVLSKVLTERFLSKDPEVPIPIPVPIPVVLGGLTIELAACQVEAQTGSVRAVLRMDVPRAVSPDRSRESSREEPSVFRVELESKLAPGALPQDEANEERATVRSLLAAQTADRLIEAMVSKRDAMRSWLSVLSDHALQHADVSLAAEAYARLEMTSNPDEDSARRAALSAFLDEHLE
ncbi:MAG: hypothetical protein H6729_10830 [Deltaproteobacteria bacterium]|nr:hypothetical protein [Deltaproteobacteria bacterium]